MKYNFTLKDNNDRSYRQFTWFLFFLHIIAAGVFALNTNENKVRISIYILLGFYALLSTGYFFLKQRKNAFETFSLILALLYANFWFQHVGIIAALVFFVIYFVVALVKGKKTNVLIADSGVHLTRVFKTVDFPWTEIDNVVLKDNLLTIDFKTNKIIQVEVAETAKAVDETEFNLFCSALLQN